MKFLLVAINAKYIHSNLAVYCLKSYADKFGNSNHNIEIAEYTINQYADEIMRDIYRRKPDVICFSCYIWNIDMVREISADYKKICPQTDIWAGGPEVSYNVRQVLCSNPQIDYIMYGEGEEILKNVVNSYDNSGINKTKLENIKGIGYRTSDNIKITHMQPPIELSTVPFVYNNLKDFENKIIYYETSRGCPFSCSYCLSSIDKKLRFRDLELVKKELKFFIDNKVAQVKFVDRTFNCNHNHALEIWQFIKDNDNGVTNFHFEIAADLMREDEIDLISSMRCGLIQLEIGVQSTNERTLTAINRKTNILKIKNTVNKIQKNKNIHQHLDLIAGLPFEDYQSFANSFNDVYAMQPDQLQLGFLKVLHGSGMRETYNELNVVYSSHTPYEVLCTNWLKYDDILKLKEIENVVEIYYNSFQFENTMKYLVKEFESPFIMYEKLGEFYSKVSANKEKHSRVNNFKILLQFINENLQNKKVDVDWIELLTVDYYLRENAKNRPAFSKDLSKHKDAIKNFYRSENLRKVLPDYQIYNSKQIEKMTHIEVIQTKSSRKRYLLFDYKNRNRLNHQASVTDISDYFI